MKKRIALFVIVNLFCLKAAVAQRSSKASDACPGSNKNTRTSKQYAALSTRSAADNTSNFSKPRYQSIYAKKGPTNTELRRGKSVVDDAKAVENKRTSRIEAPVEKKASKPVEAKQPVVERTLADESPIAEEVEFTPVEKTVEENPTSSKPFVVIPVEKTTVPKITKETGTTESSKKSTASNTKPKAKTSNTAAKKAGAKEKEQKSVYRKKIRIGKKCATDCPQF